MVAKIKVSKKATGIKDDGAMRQETRKRRKAFDFLKVILKFAFSQAGVILLCVVYAVVGANIYLSQGQKGMMYKIWGI